MAKKKKKKAVKKMNISSNRKKVRTNSTKKKSTASKLNTNVKSKSSSKKNSNVSNVKKINKNTNHKKNVVVKKNVNDTKKVNNNKNRGFNKKIFIIFFILAVLIIFAIIFLNINMNSSGTNNSFQKISFDEYLDLYKKEELEFIYLYHSSCINCDTYEEKLTNLEKEFDIKLKKFDYSKLNDSDLSILKSSNAFLENGIEVPMIISIKEGNEISSVSGIKEYSALKNFVTLSKSEQGTNKFNKIDIDEYLSILNSKEKSLIYICDSSDGCDKFTSVLESVCNDREVKVNYLNTENITSSDDWNTLESSSKIFEDMWFMPVLMIVKDNKVVDYKMETLSEKDLNKFFKSNGM